MLYVSQSLLQSNSVDGVLGQAFASKGIEVLRNGNSVEGVKIESRRKSHGDI